MPLFEFVCRACGHRFEALIFGARTAACPKCASTSLDKLVSSFGTRSPDGRNTNRPASPFT
jgi:putative FmdB family regulatory protein